MVTAEERMEFLKQRGWRETMSQEDKARLEEQWDDDDIELATNLGF